MRSISAGSAPATAQAIACRTMRSYRRSRSGAGTVFESHTPGMWRSGCRTTAAATTGPARHPRPTSSTPATCANPTRRSAFSSVRVADTRAMYGLARGFVDFLHARRLALQVAQIVKLRATDLRRAHEVDLVNRRRMQREDALHALAERHFADGEGCAGPAAVHADHDAFEDLDALLIALAHLDVHPDGVAGLHGRPLRQLRFFDDFNGSHCMLLILTGQTGPLRFAFVNQLPQNFPFLIVERRIGQQIRPSFQRPRQRRAFAPSPNLR